MRRLLFVAILLVLTALPLSAAYSMLLASRRGGTIEAINPGTLATGSRIATRGEPGV